MLLSLFLVSTTNYEIKGYEEPVVEVEVDAQQGGIYRNYGTVYIQNFPDGSVIQLDAYIWKQLNNSGYYSHLKYMYTLTAVSKSVHQGYYTQTWLYGNRIFYNGIDYTAQEFPQGMTTYVQTYPTAIYTIYSNDEHIPAFGMQWQSSAYENRIKR